ncbi:uncharacterized protein LOC120333170 [Styela clava]
MIFEDKVISSTYGDTYSRISNEEDSLLSAESSPNITSPSSTSAHSGTGSSVDEGVDMTVDQDICKRVLFVPSMERLKHGISDHFDQPLDLTIKKLKNISERFDSKSQKKELTQSRRESSELVIDESRSPKSNQNTENVFKIGSGNNTPSNSPPISAIPNTFGSSFVPWTYAPTNGTVPFLSTSVPSLWNPAFFMSQAARHFSPSIAWPYSFPTSSIASSPLTNSKEALQHIYGHNMFAEFTRICSQAQNSHQGRDTSNSVGRTETSPISAKSEKCSRVENHHQQYARDNGVFIKKERTSPDIAISRKRKLEETLQTQTKTSEISPRSTDSLTSVPVGKRIRQDYKNGMFDNTMDRLDSPPTMVHNIFNTTSIINTQQIENNKMVARPIDFKPCRFPCKECGRTYATVGGLLKHSKTHQETESSNNFKCVTCEKEYNSLGALKMHIRTHTLPCKCHICGKAFSRTWLLQGHIRTHTGEKPYQCTVCSRAFADRSNLRAHMQTHESVKRYACTSCDRTFSRISLLNRHRVSGCPSTTSLNAQDRQQAMESLSRFQGKLEDAVSCQSVANSQKFEEKQGKIENY